MRFDDRLTGGLVLAAGLLVTLQARTFPSVAGQAVGPGLFPTAIGVALAVFGVALIIGGLGRTGAPLVTFDRWTRRPRMLRNLAVVLGAVAFYAIASEPLGFFPTAIAVLAGLWTVFGVRPVWTAALGVGATLVLHYFFYTVLRVPLPWGVLRGVAW